MSVPKQYMHHISSSDIYTGFDWHVNGASHSRPADKDTNTDDSNERFKYEPTACWQTHGHADVGKIY